ncbi:MAG: serine/threonine-protein kinase [Steroidobacterales bacterium]
MTATPQRTEVTTDRLRSLLSALLSDTHRRGERLRDITATCSADPEAAWELLALIDRYHRLGQMPTDLFQTAKRQIEELALGRAAPESPRAGSENTLVGPETARGGAENTQEMSAQLRATPASTAAPAMTAAPAALASPPRPHLSSSKQQIPSPAAQIAPQAGGAALAPPGPGRVLRERYELLEVVGRGGMGTVYKALDKLRSNLQVEERYIAVKILHAEHSRRPELLAAFGREFYFTQTLSHPNIVNVYEFERKGDINFFTMELLDGAHLNQILSRSTTSPVQRAYALAIIRDVGAALSHAHSRGVVHGDLKPQNIIITSAGEVRVLDFGAACLLRREPWISEFSPFEDYRSATPGYASCEVLEGMPPDPRDDIFALACIAYVLLSGNHPFRGKPSTEARSRRLRLPRPRGLRTEQWQALRQALNWSRERRPRDLEAWLGRLGLQKAAPRLPPLSLLSAAKPRRPPLIAAAALAALIAAAIAVWMFAQPSNRSDADAAVQCLQSALTGAWQQWRAQLAPAPARAVAASQQATSPMPAPVAVTAPTLTSPAGATSGKGPAFVAPASGAAASAADSATYARSAAKLAFASAAYYAPAGQPTARIVVRRLGNSDNDIHFVWWTEAGTAKANVDYASFGEKREHLKQGEHELTVFVPIVSSPARRAPATFYVALAIPSPGSNIASVERTAVTIEP